MKAPNAWELSSVIFVRGFDGNFPCSSFPAKIVIYFTLRAFLSPFNIQCSQGKKPIQRKRGRKNFSFVSTILHFHPLRQNVSLLSGIEMFPSIFLIGIDISNLHWYIFWNNFPEFSLDCEFECLLFLSTLKIYFLFFSQNFLLGVTKHTEKLAF